MTDTPSFYMKVDLPDGTTTDGRIDYRHLPGVLGLDQIPAEDHRVLDIAANDGFWAFWYEQHGSRDVLAIDVDSYEGYDWGWDGPPSWIGEAAKRSASQWSGDAPGFWHLHRAFDSSVQRERLSIYDLDPGAHGSFDIVLNFGLIYHLRHPLLALDRVRAVNPGIHVIETHILNVDHELPMSLFYRSDELKVVTNWTGPTRMAVANWLIDAGYPHVYLAPTRTDTAFSRQIFVACATDDWAARFEHNPELTLVDDSMLRRSWEQTRDALGLPHA